MRILDQMVQYQAKFSLSAHELVEEERFFITSKMSSALGSIETRG